MCTRPPSRAARGVAPTSLRPTDTSTRRQIELAAREHAVLRVLARREPAGGGTAGRVRSRVVAHLRVAPVPSQSRGTGPLHANRSPMSRVLAGLLPEVIHEHLHVRRLDRL